MKIAENIAKILSYVFSPFIVPVYSLIVAFFTTYLYTVPLSSRIDVLLVVAGITILLPIGGIYVLRVLGVIKDFSLIDRKERKYPYVIVFFCYGIALFYLKMVHAPLWLLCYVLGGMGALIITAVVNMRWKISGHATAIGCATVLILYIGIKQLNVYPFDGWVYGVFVVSGIVGTSRLILGRHTLAQIACGYLNGLIVTSLLMFLI